MNKLFTAVIIGLLMTVASKAQGDMHTIKVLRDDPNGISNHIVGLNICHAQFSKYEHLKAGFGTEVVWGLGPKFQVESNFMFYYLCIRNAQGPDFTLEGGTAFTLSSHTRTKNLKVILSYSESKTQTATTTTTYKEVKYLVQPGTALAKTSLRTGAYYKVAGMDASDELSPALVKYTGVGIYGGLEFSTQACLFSEVDGVKGITSGYTRIYLDGIFLPVSKFDATTNDPGNLGFRVGFATYYNPNKKNNSEFGKLKSYQTYPSLFFKSEAGIRGGDGWFFNLGLGWMIHRNK